VNKLRIAFDIDGTICVNTNGKYDEAKPFHDMIEFINDLYDNGHYIIIHTARGMGRNDNISGKAFTSMYRMTQNQLDLWNLKYNELHLGKIHADLYVDDKGFCVKYSKNCLSDLKEAIKCLQM